jgi:hypothetical protein
MFDRATGFPRFRSLVLLIAIGCLLLPLVSQAQVMVKVNDNVNFKFGTLMQMWADSAQDATSQSYAQNLFLRRFRFLAAGQISPNISFFFETDNPNLGKNKSSSALNTGFITQDAFIEWKPTGSNAFIVDGGLMLPPLCRNCLESAASLLSLDYGSFSFNESGPTQSSVGRDTGFLAKGYLMKGHLEYRGGVFDGVRQAGVAKNRFRETARLQYNFWDTETGYVYPGLYLGNKKILAVGVGGDRQQHYGAYTADAFLSLPVTPAKNAINGELTYLHFNGGTTFTALPLQDDATLQAGYYLSAMKVMPFARYERQDFKDAVNDSKDNNREQVGLTWYPNGHNFNIKGAYSRVKPRVGNKTNEYTVQMQFFYF